MKTITKRTYIRIIVFIVLCFGIFSCENNDPPSIPDNDLITTDFAPLGAKWYFSQGFAWSENVEYLTIESVDDTIIQSKNCKILEKKGSLICTYYNERDFVYREKDIVYFYSPETNKFQVLYNLKANKGSSWINTFSQGFQVDSNAPSDTVLVKVDSLGVLKVNNFELKTFYVTYRSLNKNYEDWHYNGLIVEKIGDITFLFNFQEAGTFCETEEKGLKCYEDTQLGRFYLGSDSCNLENWTNK